MVGWRREDLLSGRTCPSITHPDDQDQTADAIGNLLKGGEQSTIEKRYVRPDGSFVWALSSFSAIRDETGRLVGALVIITDINEAKLIAESIRESEARFRDLIEALGLAVYTTDAEGTITLYNDTAATLWGRPPVLGEDKWCGSWRIFTPAGEPMDLDSCPMAVTLKTGIPVRDEEILVERPDGSRANVLPYPSPLRDASGALTGAVNVLVDVTELKATQAALQEAIRAKDDFLGQVSHELRTPITQIGGNAEVLRRRWHQLSAELQQASLEEINTQTKRMQRLIDNMMVLSRIERGLLPDLEPQLVQRLVHDTVAQFRERFPATVVELRIDPALPPVETSAATIDQVIYNLLTNAQKYGPPLGPIEIEAVHVDGWVEIRVLDHGPGVSELDIDRIFEPYFRAATTPEHASGIGLGLSVCKRLVEAQGGYLWARRRQPQGMEFGVRLPVLDDADHV
jgi:PAS domain S-box-containing protein